MTSVQENLEAAAALMGPKPSDSEKQSVKKRYSEQLSEKLAIAFANSLRDRGMKEARPAPPGVLGKSGAERRISGGIGAKKVDVTWATEESGLILAISIKTINFRDRKTGNFQKNLTNRRSDMLMEAVTLHRRFPYAVVAGFLLLDSGAASDGTTGRSTTLQNAHERLKLFTGRIDPSGRDEQFERLFVALIELESSKKFSFFEVGKSSELDVEAAVDEILKLVAERNSDLYEYRGARIERRRASGKTLVDEDE
jgi:hypothetical protein